MRNPIFHQKHSPETRAIFSVLTRRKTLPRPETARSAPGPGGVQRAIGSMPLERDDDDRARTIRSRPSKEEPNADDRTRQAPTPLASLPRVCLFFPARKNAASFHPPNARCRGGKGRIGDAPRTIRPGVTSKPARRRSKSRLLESPARATVPNCVSKCQPAASHSLFCCVGYYCQTVHTIQYVYVYGSRRMTCLMLDLGESEKGTGGADQAAASDRSGTGGQTDCPYPAVSTLASELQRFGKEMRAAERKGCDWSTDVFPSRFCASSRHKKPRQRPLFHGFFF